MEKLLKMLRDENYDRLQVSHARQGLAYHRGVHVQNRTRQGCVGKVVNAKTHCGVATSRLL